MLCVVRISAKCNTNTNRTIDLNLSCVCLCFGILNIYLAFTLKYRNSRICTLSHNVGVRECLRSTKLRTKSLSNTKRDIYKIRSKIIDLVYVRIVCVCVCDWCLSFSSSSSSVNGLLGAAKLNIEI